MKTFFKKFKPSSRSHSPAGSDHHSSSTSTPIPHASTSDNSAVPIPVTSTGPTTLVGTQAETLDVKDDKKPVPTIAVEECPTPLATISTPSKKRFVDVKTKNAQHDLVLLHIAYILQKFSNLQTLILEIVKLSENHAVREPSCCSFEYT